jgi:hemerythrin-like metal-binding protein
MTGPEANNNPGNNKRPANLLGIHNAPLAALPPTLPNQSKLKCPSCQPFAPEITLITIASTTTGHHGIDAQHDELSTLIANLGAICQGSNNPDTSLCSACSPEHRSACTERLANLIAELLGFMVEHFAYEEKLMRLLPRTETCLHHIESHQMAHAEVSRQLSELAQQLDKENPRQCAQNLQHIVSAWMGAHSQGMDSVLASELQASYENEVHYDIELSKLLQN